MLLNSSRTLDLNYIGNCKYNRNKFTSLSLVKGNTQNINLILTELYMKKANASHVETRENCVTTFFLILKSKS